ncbi:YrzE family protein [Arthrobacter sp. FW306-2-2C-D06B]|uniref:YrzE family protein n=1 Tax=Arthrobacter sp. FW306-2-2C-D06B TaxID=2879618 RepID=UPI001F240013|nr:YrzE family protein [Arthrobacter sp. FW306-2-2C-D06B]UKA57078.1 YrzE family protein [Arthrobacter sp. FW306-2-2C-D06B]
MSSATGSDGKHVRADGSQDEIPYAAEPRRDQVADARGTGPVYPDDSYVGNTSSYPVVSPASDPNAATRETVIAREKEQFGGIKIGSAFFGWLTATGMAVLLVALVAAAGIAVGLANNANVSDAANLASSQPVGVAGIIALLVILFLSYYCGGYVAGRMARFNGIKQGLMVWFWAIIVAVLVALLGLFAGPRFNILATVNSFPRIPVNEGQLSTIGIIAALVVAAVTLIAAALGGLAGMHYHRRVDRAGFTPPAEDVEA